jgi:isocitrate dehydrogenase
VLLSGEMMFRRLGWTEVADSLIRGIERSIGDRQVTYDFHRQMEGATLLKTSEFADAIIARL